MSFGKGGRPNKNPKRQYPKPPLKIEVSNSPSSQYWIDLRTNINPKYPTHNTKRF
tara:strand:- start:294 stop:458 length:165 start_codon:yes stop_codon:yes gene_type:complete